MMRSSVFLTSIFLSITVTLAVGQQVESDELVVYANDVHEVANNRRDRDARVIAWFRRYLR